MGGTGWVPTSVLKNEKGFGKKNDVPTHEVTFHVQNPPTINSARSLKTHYEAIENIMKEAWKFHKVSLERNDDQILAETSIAQINAGLKLLANINTDIQMD